MDITTWTAAAAVVGAAGGTVAMARTGRILRRLEELDARLAGRSSTSAWPKAVEGASAQSPVAPIAVPITRSISAFAPPASAPPLAAIDPAPRVAVAVAAPVERVDAPLEHALAQVVARVESRRERAAASPAQAPGLDLEQHLGRRVATWVGAVAVLCAAGFYFQLASSRGWLPPGGKIALAMIAGVIAALAGDRFIRKDARALGQGVLGLGLGLMFGALHVGCARYELYGAMPASLGMIAVTVVGMALAVRRDSAPVAVLAVLGAYLAPALAWSDGGRELLCTYLFVLDLGVLGVALYRDWRGLEALALVGTWVLYGLWYQRAIAPEPVATSIWAMAFAALFLIIPLAFHLLRRKDLTRARLALAGASAVIGYAFTWFVLDGRAALAAIALGLAAAHAIVLALVRRRLRHDGFTHAVLAILAAAWATLAIPLALRDHGLVLGWAIEAPVLLVLGARYRLTLVRWAGAAVLALATAALAAMHWPAHDAAFTPFANAAFASGMMVAAMAAIYAALGLRLARRLGEPALRHLARGAALLAGVLTMGLVHAEITAAMEVLGHAHGAPLVVLAWWLVASAALVAWARRGDPDVSLAALAGTAICALGALVVASHPVHGALVVNPRFAVLVAACAVIFAFGRVAVRVTDRAHSRELFAMVARIAPWAAGGLLVLFTSREVFEQALGAGADAAHARWIAHAALSCTWSLFAAAALIGGFAYRVRHLRLVALAMFGITAAKVVLVDLAQVQQVYRVTSLLVLGLLLLGASWLYHRLGERVRR
ncbi:MAG: DUF2339 domain-containing protein [Deltaproteobacteria bacterium]|nr:DUF2339 domain-containing protein [Deltaproteobacteria bacterium]